MASVPATCADAFKAVGVSEVAKPQQVLQCISTCGSDLTLCAVARCPQGGYFTGSSISSWPEAQIWPVVTYTDAEPIIAARPDESEHKATLVMGMWQLAEPLSNTPANVRALFTTSLPAYCKVCDA